MAGLWLGLFAMLMIHAGPLYSASQLGTAAPAAAAPVPHQHHHDAHVQPPLAYSAAHPNSQPAWLASLGLCGYCELLTLSPPLVLAFAPALPYFPPSYARLISQQPLPALLRCSGGHARAPPVFRC